ncbi:WxcM-like domain-containing protein [Aeromonas veronii]|nr:WxcM-like domain-containing protein [Aeromonas veronii]
MDEMIKKSKKGFMLTPLKQISHEKGDIFHAMKASSEGFHGFGEAYFSCVNHSEIKGWKQHTKMVLNLVVICGEVQFYIYDDVNKKVDTVILGRSNYQRLTVLPGMWVAFQGIGEVDNILLNISSIEHDPEESLNMPLDAFPFKN